MSKNSDNHLDQPAELLETVEPVGKRVLIRKDKDKKEVKAAK